MPRTPILPRLAAILDAAPVRAVARGPQSFTHRELAQEVYGVDDPTAAQLSAVRRAVAKLVADGRAERAPERLPSAQNTGKHRRRRRDSETSRVYANPAASRCAAR